MEIKTETCRIATDGHDAGTVWFQGSLRLNGAEEYAPIVQLLDEQLELGSETITLDLQELEFLNSSGINVLSKFVIRVRQQGGIQMIVKGSQAIPWQGKSLKNLKRLLPSLVLELE